MAAWSLVENNTLDRVYYNIKHGYRAVPLPHLGLSDHVSLFHVPAYTSLRKRIIQLLKPSKPGLTENYSNYKTVLLVLNGTLFKHQDVAEYTQTVLFYIASCTDMSLRRSTSILFPNQKPWMTSEVHTLLRARDMAFKSGDRALYSVVRANLKNASKMLSWPTRGR